MNFIVATSFGLCYNTGIFSREKKIINNKAKEGNKAMNSKNNNQNKGGKVYTRVVFLMAQNPYTDMWEPMALFPDLYWDAEKRENVSYQHCGQHGPCCKAFALLDCIAPKRQHLKAVERLKKELESLDEPYALTVLDSAEWLKENAALAKDLEKNTKHYEMAAEEPSEKVAELKKMENDTMAFMDELLDDGFSETKKAISELFEEEFAELKEGEDRDYSDLEEEEEYIGEGTAPTEAEEGTAAA